MTVHVSPESQPALNPPKGNTMDETCAHHDCTATATDSRHGMPLCLAHLFLALQWELQPA